MIKQWLPKQKTVLARNPDWKGTPPYFDEIEIRPIEDVKTAEIGFEAGDIDYTWISLASLAKYKSKPPTGARLIERPSLAYVWLGQNTEHANLQDIRVRKAIQRAVDSRDNHPLPNSPGQLSKLRLAVPLQTITPEWASQPCTWRFHQHRLSVFDGG